MVVKRANLLYDPGMSEIRQWIVPPEQAGMRLDHFLTAELEGITRSAIQKLIKNGEILINDASSSVHRFLKGGEKIEWKPVMHAPRNKKGAALAPALVPTIVAESSDWIVLNKPVGLIVHPSASSDETTLVDWLVERNPAMAHVGEDPSRPGIVHRLDREVSGLLVVAKTQAMFDLLKRAFAEREVKKHYIALAHGELSKDLDDIKLKIARSTKGNRMAARPIGEEGKAAWTHYEVKERFAGATFVDIEILSGRTHQIRAHFHGIGHPLIGDPLYKRRETDRRVKAPRLMLQSVALHFPDLDGTVQSFTIDPDPTFGTMIEEFRHS